MRNFNKKYNFVDIYSNFKAFKPEKNFININADNSNPVKTPIISQIKISTIIKIFKISNFNFNKICEPCIKSKKT